MSKKVFIGVGHGGSDPGATANGFKEKELNLEVAKACRDALKLNGVDVAISRENDESENLSQRIKEANAFNPDIAVDIHHNAGGGDGAEVYHGKNDKSDDLLAENILTEIFAIGQNMHSTTPTKIESGMKTKVTSRGTDYFGFIRQIKCPSVLIECAFVDSKDVQIVDTAAERKAMGVAIAKGILKTLGIAYKETTENTATGSFFPARGYFRKGDSGAEIHEICKFFATNYYSYLGNTKKTAKVKLLGKKGDGDYFGINLYKWVKEFQRRTGLETDGNIGPLTLAMLEKYGFKR